LSASWVPSAFSWVRSPTSCSCANARVPRITL
jgi:hypothetical protein